MGRRLCLPGADRSRNVCAGRGGGDGDRTGDGGLPGAPGGEGESREEFEGGINNRYAREYHLSENSLAQHPSATVVFAYPCPWTGHRHVRLYRDLSYRPLRAEL